MFEGHSLSEKIDVYSFGVLLWECLTGEVPWSDLDSPMQVRALQFVPMPPRSLISSNLQLQSLHHERSAPCPLSLRDCSSSYLHAVGPKAHCQSALIQRQGSYDATSNYRRARAASSSLIVPSDTANTTCACGIASEIDIVGPLACTIWFT